MDIHSVLGKGIEMPEYINDGGCGFAALYMYRVLKRKGIQVAIVAFNYCKRDIDDIAFHYGIKVHGYYYDTCGEIVDNEVLGVEYKYVDEVPEEVLRMLLKQRWGWNPDFDRCILNVLKVVRSIHYTIERQCTQVA